MKIWLPYSGAFACALGTAVLSYMAAFYALMSGASFGIAGFVLLAVILPVLAGLVVFGAAYSAFAGRGFDAQGWGQGIAFVAVVAATAFGLIVTGMLPEILVMVLFVAALFFGGLIMVKRASNE